MLTGPLPHERRSPPPGPARSWLGFPRSPPSRRTSSSCCPAPLYDDHRDQLKASPSGSVSILPSFIEAAPPAAADANFAPAAARAAATASAGVEHATFLQQLSHLPVSETCRLGKTCHLYLGPVVTAV